MARAQMTSGFYRSYSPLQYAVHKEFVDLLAILIQEGVDVNATTTFSKDGALHMAARKGNPQIINMLLLAGAEVDARDEDGDTALHEANDVIGYREAKPFDGGTLNAGADPNTIIKGAFPSEGILRTTLVEAVHKTDVQLVMILLKAEAGADVNAPPSDDSGVTALQTAAIVGSIDVAHMLLDAHADVDAAPAKKGRQNSARRRSRTRPH
ncbi:hypothetical protein VTN00DRAFT_8183 [Thermoascus crustaceus]|uniref:uncharacterized protein n=1 Tax=Thermoascus crustaceus TaxID=5088 RepID=UPI0037443AE3